MEYLLFRLYGPLASWGEIAVGESRHTADSPSKSSLLGLLAASIGIRRDEEERQMALAIGYKFAVKVMGIGSLLRDYHTTQVPDSVGGYTYRTRRDELVIGKERLGTILSSREYRCDALYLVAVKALEGAPYPLSELKEHLLKPRFHLYLGRKSCPLSIPLAPVVILANCFGEALDSYRHTPLYISQGLLSAAQKECAGGALADAPSLGSLSREDRYALSLKSQQVRYYWEGDTGEFRDTAEGVLTLTRHDQPLSRRRWQFTQRSEKLTMAKEDS